MSGTVFASDILFFYRPLFFPTARPNCSPYGPGAPTMTLSQLQDYTFNTKYARWNPALGRRETYVEAVDRVFSMHERVYAGYPVHEEIAYAKQAARERLVLGSQRALYRRPQLCLYALARHRDDVARRAAGGDLEVSVGGSLEVLTLEFGVDQHRSRAVGV